MSYPTTWIKANQADELMRVFYIDENYNIDTFLTTIKERNIVYNTDIIKPFPFQLFDTVEEAIRIQKKT